MKVRPLLIGMVACSLLPLSLSVANARPVVEPGLHQAGAGADLQRDAVRTAENFGRQEKENNDRRGDRDDSDHRGDKDDGHKGDRDDGHKGDKSPCKP